MANVWPARPMTDDLTRLEGWTSELLAKLSAAERRKLTRNVAIDLRRTQRKRIAAQRNPDGSAFEPRKPRPPLRAKQGRIKRRTRERTMFAKLRQAKYLKADGLPGEATVGFAGQAVTRIARVHHYGLRDRVDKDPRAKKVEYPSRRLLGHDPGDDGPILDRILDHLAG